MKCCLSLSRETCVYWKSLQPHLIVSLGLIIVLSLPLANQYPLGLSLIKCSCCREVLSALECLNHVREFN